MFQFFYKTLLYNTLIEKQNDEIIQNCSCFKFLRNLILYFIFSAWVFYEYVALLVVSFPVEWTKII